MNRGEPHPVDNVFQVKRVGVVWSDRTRIRSPFDARCALNDPRKCEHPHGQ